jgi:MFS family permease
MTIPLHEMFIPRRFAVIALLLCLMEMVIFGLLIAIVHLSFGYSSGIQFVAAITYLICVPGSFIFAIVGLIFDRRRTAALIACGAAIACGYFCTLQVLV